MSRLYLGIGHGLANGAKIQAAQRLSPTVALVPNYSKRYSQTQHRTQSFGQTIQIRNLYTDYSLGMDSLDRLQEQKGQLFAGAAKDRYLERLSTFGEQNDTKSILRDDMFNLVGIVDNDEQLSFFEDFVVRTKDDPQVFTKGLGVMVMRLYKKLGKIDRAVENLKDVDRFGDFFLQRTSYKIAMTMLFNAGRYRDVLDLYHLADERLTQADDSTGEQLLAPLAFGALAKMETEEAFREAQQLFDKLSESRPQTGATRSIQFVAYLAVKYNEPKYALHLISKIQHGLPLATKELKIRCLMLLERYDDIPIQLREFIKTIRRDTSILLKSTYETIEQYTDKVADPDVRKELGDILVEIKDGGHIMESDLEAMLFKEINFVNKPLPRMNDRYAGSRPFRRDGGAYNAGQYNNYQNNRRDRYNNNREGDRAYNDREADRDDYQPRRRDRQQSSQNKRFTYQNVDFST